MRRLARPGRFEKRYVAICGECGRTLVLPLRAATAGAARVEALRVRWAWDHVHGPRCPACADLALIAGEART